MDHPVVLIHSSQPWLAEGAYVAQILPRVYLETSITMPWSSLALDNLLELLLGVAPTNKVLYGSDESTDPEVLWLSALVGREALERVLGRALAHGWVDQAEAGRIGAGVLGGNVLKLHGLAG
jgi:predicted TIM-barrel fold metal-dependent hydrolase